MSMTEAFQNLQVTGFTSRVTHLSLHAGDPGTTGASDSGIAHKALSWTTPTDGISTATATFTALVGTFPWAGLWDGATFRMGIPVGISNTVARDVVVMVSHEVT